MKDFEVISNSSPCPFSHVNGKLVLQIVSLKFVSHSSTPLYSLTQLNSSSFFSLDSNKNLHAIFHGSNNFAVKYRTCHITPIRKNPSLTSHYLESN